jgi:DNA-directed RNA polymerase specialized sigma24 family protein
MASDSPTGGGHFVTTHWSAVLAAGREDSAAARQALEELCRTYWAPLHAYARRRGYSPDAAADLTQGFFTRLIASRDLAQVDPAKGRFRSFLLASLKHFLANDWDRAQAQVRGGGTVHVPLDPASSNGNAALDPVDTLTPERVFERQWALTLLNMVLDQLQGEYAADGKAALFDALKGSLTGERPSAHYARIGIDLGLSEGAVKVAAHRLRARYRERLRQAIARTVASEEEIDEEIRYLFAAFAP